MRLIRLSCRNCGAQLEIDLDHLQVYCPYCGQKLMIDSKQLERVLSEREKTKRTVFREEEQTKRIQMEHEYQERKEKRDNTMTGLILIGYILFSFFIIGFSFFMANKEERSHAERNEIQITFSAKEVQGENYEEVMKRFTSLGFRNIKLIKDKDLIFAIFSSDGKVEKVTIAGDSSFSNGDWVSVDSEIAITYHTYKDKA